MNKAAKVALGCLLFPVGLTTLLVILFAAMRMAGVPDPVARSERLAQDLPASRTELVRDGTEISSGSSPIQIPEGDLIDVVISLEEGVFEVIPGPAAEGIRVSADYDEASYELVQTYHSESSPPRYELKLRSKVSFWRRIADDGAFDESDMEQNQVTVQLPIDRPMRLSIEMQKGQGTIELDGLALVDLKTKLKMGEFDLDVREDNPVNMERVSFELSMGEFRIDGLSYLAPATITAKASMGEIGFDFGGPLRRDTELITKMRLGEMSLRVPENARWDEANELKAVWGEVSGDEPGRSEPGEGPLLSVKSSVFMGELVVDSYRTNTSVRRSRRD